MKTNRDYYSWSQYFLWNSSVKEFYKKYVVGKESKTNKRFEKGKEFGRFKETGEIPGWIENPDMLKLVGDAVDALDIMEHKIECEIGGFKLLSYIDTGNADYSALYEYKTGKEPWTQERVNLHEQLDFYALMYYIASGETIIPQVKLYWIETEDIIDANGDTKIVYTGHTECFERVITKDDLVMMLRKILDFIKQVDAYEYKEYEIDDVDANRYAFLKQRMKDDKEEADLLNLKISSQLEANKVKFGESSKVSFTLSETKKKIYTEELTQKEKKYKDEIAYEKKLEEKQGKVKTKVSTSLRFKVKELK